LIQVVFKLTSLRMLFRHERVICKKVVIEENTSPTGAPLIREPGRVVSTGRALVPTQPNFNELFIFDFETLRRDEDHKPK
jgi:hypothetical protein